MTQPQRIAVRQPVTARLGKSSTSPSAGFSPKLPSLPSRARQTKRLVAQSSKEEAEPTPVLAGGPPGSNNGGSGGGGDGSGGSGSGGSAAPAGVLLAGKAVESLPAGLWTACLGLGGARKVP